MSAENSHDRVRQEPDRIAARRIIGVGVGALLVFAIGITWAVGVQRDMIGGLRTEVSPPAAKIGHREIGIVYQPLFEKASIAAEKTAAARARLAGSGFVDAQKQTVHIPIERAMQMVAARGRL
jgi:hypothetical protein